MVMDKGAVMMRGAGEVLSATWTVNGYVPALVGAP
jgi:hypothetical protein